MTFWILPWNKEVYDLPQCLEDFGFVEWRQKNKLAVDDIVYLYCSTPIKQIMYMMRVSKINISKEDSINDEYLYNYRYPIKETDFYARLEPIAKAQDNNPELSYSKLQKLGIRSQIQGGIRVPEILLSHLLKNFNAVYDDLTQSFIEGDSKKSSITYYERNPRAREICLKEYGYTCKICGMNFEKVYGEIGKNFIHVHHIEFISSFEGKEYQLNPIEGLIPVCPNCHAMLHRKLNGKYQSPLELKKIISKNGQNFI